MTSTKQHTGEYWQGTGLPTVEGVGGQLSFPSVERTLGTRQEVQLRGLANVLFTWRLNAQFVDNLSPLLLLQFFLPASLLAILLPN